MSQRGDESGAVGSGLERVDWEVQHQPLGTTFDRQRPALGVKHHARSHGLESLKHHPGGGQRRVTAQRHFFLRGEPADLAIASVSYEVRRLGQIVLGRDGEQRRLRQPSLEHYDRGWITGKAASAERVNLPDGKLHAYLL